MCCHEDPAQSKQKSNFKNERSGSYIPTIGLHRRQVRQQGADPLRRRWQPTPVFLPGKAHGQGSLLGCSPWRRRGVRHDLATERATVTLPCKGTHEPPLPTVGLQRGQRLRKETRLAVWLRAAVPGQIRKIWYFSWTQSCMGTGMGSGSAERALWAQAAILPPKVGGGECPSPGLRRAQSVGRADLGSNRNLRCSGATPALATLFISWCLTFPI